MNYCKFGKPVGNFCRNMDYFSFLLFSVSARTTSDFFDLASGYSRNSSTLSISPDMFVNVLFTPSIS